MTTKFFSHLSKKRQNSGRKEGDQRPEVLEQTGVPISAVAAEAREVAGLGPKGFATQGKGVKILV